jgi:hypothetical protein
VIEKGIVVHSGTASECIANYLRQSVPPVDAGASPTSVHVTRIEALSDGASISGDRTKFVLTGEAQGRPSQRQELVGVRVRSQETGVMVFSKTLSDVEFQPGMEGEFSLAFGLQLNVPAGIYGVEGFVRDRTWDWWLEGQGATTYVQVTDASAFYGSVQLNMDVTSMRLPPERPAGRL